MPSLPAGNPSHQQRPLSASDSGRIRPGRGITTNHTNPEIIGVYGGGGVGGVILGISGDQQACVSSMERRRKQLQRRSDDGMSGSDRGGRAQEGVG